MKKILNIILFSVISLNSFGTTFTPNVIIYNGDTLSLFAYPLEQLYQNDSIRPDFFGDIEGCARTDCGRDYVSKWEITDNKLYLIGIYSCCYYDDGVKANLKDLFGEKCINGKVKADWVNGKMYSPQGRLLYYFGAGFQDIYETELEFTFINGVLIECKKLDNSKTKKSIYLEDQQLLREYISNNIKSKNLPASDTIKRRVYINIISSDENGKIDTGQTHTFFALII